MDLAEQRAGFDHDQKGRELSAERFVGALEPVIKAMLAAALVVEPIAPTGQLAGARRQLRAL